MDVVDKSRVIVDGGFVCTRYGSFVATERRSSQLRDGQKDGDGTDRSVKHTTINRFISGLRHIKTQINGYF